jgi:hypothetical protein
MSHLLLAPSWRDVFNSAASPSFDLPSSFLSIETIVSSRGALAPFTLFEHTTLALFVEHPTVLGVRYDLPRCTWVPTRILAWVYPP